MHINTVVFDLGGVLIDWNPRRLYAKIFQSKEAIDFFLGNITTHDWNEHQDAGRPIAEANEILIQQFPEYAPEIRAYYDQWEAEMLGGPISGTVEILKKCIDNPDIHVYSLTNWSAETFPYALEKFPFLQWFEGILVSGAEKIKKPDPAIFHLLTERYQLDPDSTLFIDDSLRNVEGARNSGWQAIHFQSPEQLNHELRNLKILP